MFINVSDVIEYLFCPRFIFFMHCLTIPQREERYYKVLRGRELHESREKVNTGYVRKRLRCVRKEVSVYMTSRRYHIKGEVDEVLFLDDRTAAPMDYKYAEYNDVVHKTHRYQLALYGLLIMEHFGIPVNRGFICYTRSNHHVEEVNFLRKDYIVALKTTKEILRIVQYGYYPEVTRQKAKCTDCTYRNICD